MKKTSVVSVKDLTKSFQEKPLLPWKPKGKLFTAVDHVSFELHEGEILGLLGPNGAGKTTTIQMLLSVLSPTSGSIRYFGKDLKTARSEVLKDVAFASTYINLPFRLTVWENLDVYARLYGLGTADRQKRIERFLKFFGIWNLRDKERSTLSAGQSTRLMLSKAFLAYPKVVLLDEPTASLDPDIAHEVRTFVQEQRNEYGVSVLFTSHNMDEVTAVCDRVMFLKSGKIIADDTPDNLARSISKTTLQLFVSADRDRLVKLAHTLKLETKIENEWVNLLIDEHEVAQFLSLLARENITYSQIRINEPSLEEYFLHMSKTV